MGEIDRHDAICWPSVVKTVINEALCPISQWGKVNSRHWLIIGLRCVVRILLSCFGVESLYCHINNFRPWIAHAQPLFEQFNDTFTFRSLRLSASFTVIGNWRPKFWATLFAERAIIWFDWIDRPETLNRLSIILILGYVSYTILFIGLKWFFIWNVAYLDAAPGFFIPPWMDLRPDIIPLVEDFRIDDGNPILARLLNEWSISNRFTYFDAHFNTYK